MDLLLLANLSKDPWPGQLIFLANLIAVVHFAWVAFLLLGLVAILLGIAFRWRWVRNRWFRVIHLAMIAIVVGESLAGVPCPLTVWEHRLRVDAGQTAFDGDFIAHWVHRLMFFQAEPWVFTVGYVTFGLAVLGVWIFAPPRWRPADA
ncbi:DUF2784 domain-containing protein [Paludisphaera mucosa]|uniref:DUF2784 domain-containing protein n=1 Tax=Paludisphaera mucosa TaxID=3030827 RepID=A0ABT6FI57_9BACT|nr:DUF2784 domain-containing protein [Paludisphaera mucosa]MDG3007063.1 DUF2784 domain-containing protein [Paludisphaera mucosa]